MLGEAAEHARRPTLSSWLWAIPLIATVVLALRALLGVTPFTDGDGWWVKAIGIPLLLPPVYLCLRKRGGEGAERLGWRLCGIGVAGQVLLGAASPLQTRAGVPDPLIAASLVPLALQFVGTSMIFSGRHVIHRYSQLLDGVTGTCAAAALLLTLLPITPPWQAGPSSLALRADELALVWAACFFAGLASNGSAFGYLGLLLGTGPALTATVTLVRLVLPQTHPAPTQLLEALWVVGLTLTGAAAMLPRRLGRVPRRGPFGLVDIWVRPSMGATVGQSALVLSACFLLMYDRSGKVPTVAIYLSAGSILLAGASAICTLREAWALADSSREARTDALTGLPNRRALLERLETSLENRAVDEHIALLVIDLDRFKTINDALGHHIGDEVLRQVGRLLADALRAQDTLARLGGDEFGVLLPPPVDADRALADAEGLCELLSAPIEVDGRTLHLGASIGVSMAPEHGDHPLTLLRQADLAMYSAKAAGGGSRAYRPEQGHRAEQDLEIGEQLREAIGRRELVLWYQPKVRPADGTPLGVEGLLRWNHPTRGVLPPGAFLDQIEQFGLTSQVTFLALRTALTDLARWREEGTVVPIAVNLFTSDLLDRLFPTQLRDAMAELDLPAHLLALEITEGTLMADPDRARDVVAELRRNGHSVSVDDYGTGYSSLAYLRNLDVDELKLDRVFVSDLVANSDAESIVRCTIELAHALGLRIVAEGVEDEATLRRLDELGCDVGQGYFMSPPLPPEALARWLREHTVGRIPAPRASERIR